MSARVHEIYPSHMEEKLSSYFTYCCSSSCCEDFQRWTEENGTLQDARQGYGAFGGSRKQGFDYLSSFGSPQLWTGIMVGVLALSMIVQNIITSRKKSRILPLLQEESSGPYSSTRMNQGGVIVPTVVYLQQRPVNRNVNAVVDDY